MRPLLARVLVLLVLVAFAVPALAGDPSGKEIIEKIKVQESYKDTVLKIKMTIVDKGGQARERLILNRVKKIGGLTHSVTTFLKPDDVKGTKFLTIENQGRDNDQWIYLPAQGRERRIIASQKGQSFMGSDFSYGDLGGREPNKGKHETLRSENRDGFDCYVVQSLPDSGDKDAQYGKTVTWVRKDIWVPVYVEFYDKNYKLQKALSAKDFRQTDGIWMAHHTEMRDLVRGTRTVIDIVGIENNKGLKDDYFSMRFLKDETQL
jgi:outer membrane lipoprotein-sorting protein